MNPSIFSLHIPHFSSCILVILFYPHPAKSQEFLVNLSTFCDFAKNPRTIVVQFSSFCPPLLEKCYFYKDFAQRVLAKEKED